MDVFAESVERVIDAALAEDLGYGDVTSRLVIPEDARFVGIIVARQEIVLAGLEIAVEVVRRVVPDATVKMIAADGEWTAAGAHIAQLEGDARGLLMVERTALNLLQFLSGIATLTGAYVKRIEGTGAVLLDTRKTVPGLRALSKYATRMGGATNHRMRLDDGILIKDNHIGVCGGVAAAVRRARAGADGLAVEVECDTLDQAREAVDAGADILLLDNMPPPMLRQAVALVGGRARTEASGGVTLETIRAIAETGVDYISVGRITQSAPAVDIGLDWHPV